MIQELNVYVVVRRNDDVLLLKRKNGLWEFPGGGVEWGEHPLTAAQRELKEETQLSCHNLSLLTVTSAVFFKDGVPKHAVYIVYECKDWDGEVKLSHEHTDYVLTSSLQSFNLCLNARGIDLEKR